MAIKMKLMAAGLSALAATEVVGTVNSGLTAAGSGQITALTLPLDDNIVFTTVGSSTGCIFGSGIYSAGDEVAIANHGANALSVYPASGGKIANGSANAAFTINTTKTAYFVCIDGLNWMASVSA